MTNFYLKTSKSSYKLKDFLRKLNNYFLNSRIRQIHLLVMFKNRWKNKPVVTSCYYFRSFIYIELHLYYVISFKLAISRMCTWSMLVGPSPVFVSGSCPSLCLFIWQRRSTRRSEEPSDSYQPPSGTEELCSATCWVLLSPAEYKLRVGNSGKPRDE